MLPDLPGLPALRGLGSNRLQQSQTQNAGISLPLSNTVDPFSSSGILPPATAPPGISNLADFTFPALDTVEPLRPSAVPFVGNPQRLANVSFKPSRLNPALAGRRGDGPAPPAGVLGRGPVSLPTSPVMRNMQLSLPSAGGSQWTALPTHTSDQMQTAIDALVTTANDHPKPYHDPATSNGAYPPDTALQPVWSDHSQHSSAEHSQPSSPLGPYSHQRDYGAQDNRYAQTARAGPSVSQPRPEYEDHRSTYEQAHHTETSQYRPSYADSSFARPGYAAQRRESDMTVALEGEPFKKKRQQVRVACTHCQKACKKCSNIRPCERCVKYGFNDCVDSSRKPRKSGVKRGPYKRRHSNKFGQSSTDFLGQPVFGRYAHYDHPSVPRHAGRPSGFYDPTGSLQSQSQYVREEDPAFQLPALDATDAALRRMPLINPFQNNAEPKPRHSIASASMHQTGGLESALTALQSSSAPRWVDGQRISGDQTNEPPLDERATGEMGEGGVPFPMRSELGRARFRNAGPFDNSNPTRPGLGGSLGLDLGGGMRFDPFSRAVSPIRETPTMERPRINIDLPLSSVQPSQYASPISAAPPRSSTHDVFGPKIGIAPLPDLHTDGQVPIKALKRIHRPSLCTLISPGISREPSPVEGDPGAPASSAKPAFLGTPITRNTSGLPSFFAEQISPAEPNFAYRPFGETSREEELVGLRPHVRDQMRGRPGDQSPVLFQGDANDGLGSDLTF